MIVLDWPILRTQSTTEQQNNYTIVVRLKLKLWSAAGEGRRKGAVRFILLDMVYTKHRFLLKWRSNVKIGLIDYSRL